MATAKFKIVATDRTKKAFRSVRRGLNRIGKQITVARLGFVALAGLAGMGLLIKRSFKLNDSLAKTADKLGITTESLATLRREAELTGVETKTLDKGLQNMVRNVADFKQGTGEAADAFRQLGLNAAALAAQKPDQQFITISKALAGVKSNTDRVNIAYRIFGGRATALLLTMDQLNKKGFKAAQAEAKALGIAISRVDAAKIEIANDAMTDVKNALSGIATNIAVQLAPAIKFLADKLIAASIESKGFKTEIIDGMRSVAKAIAFVGDVIRGVQIFFKGLQLIAALAIDGIIQNIAQFDRAWVLLQNTLANSFIGKKMGVQMAQLNDDLVHLSRGSRMMVKDLGAELDTLASKPLPTQNVDAFFNKVTAISQKAGEAIAAMRAKMQGQTDGGQGGGLTAAQKKRIESLRLAVATEEEIERARFERKAQQLRDATEIGIINKIQLDARMEALHLSHQERLTAITERAAKKRAQTEKKWNVGTAKTALGLIASTTAATATESKKMFKINKAAAMGQAIISTYEAINMALAKIPPPANFVVAALVGAAGFRNVKAIKSSKFGGGSGSAPSLGGAGATPTSTAPTPENFGNNPLSSQNNAAPQRNITVILEKDGAPISQEWLREQFIPGLNEAIGDGVTLDIVTRQ